MATPAPAAVETSIHYLVPTSRINRRFWAPGAGLSTGVYAAYPVTIGNARRAEGAITLDAHGFCLGRHRTRVVDFTDAAAVNEIYPGEVVAVVRELMGADRVVPLSGMVRSSGKTGPGCQPPAAEAHVDFTEHTARKLADKLYAQSAPVGPGYRRFLSFSLWRALSPPPQDWPLALCDGRSVRDDEGTGNVKVDVDVLPEGDALFALIAGEEDMLAATIFHHSPQHRWWYFPDMTADETLILAAPGTRGISLWYESNVAESRAGRADSRA